MRKDADQEFKRIPGNWGMDFPGRSWNALAHLAGNKGNKGNKGYKGIDAVPAAERNRSPSPIPFIGERGIEILFGVRRIDALQPGFRGFLELAAP